MKVAKNVRRGVTLLVAAMILVAIAVILVRSPRDPKVEQRYDPSTAAPPPKGWRVEPSASGTALFGELHIHTALSSDAYHAGTRGLPDDVYRFAKGGEISHPSRLPDSAS